MRTVVRFAVEVPGAGRPHGAADASADLPFRDEVVQFKTRLADEKIGWRDLA